MKIVLAAVMYSPNLGDGLIAECLTAGLQRQLPGAEIQWLDLAGRIRFEAPHKGLRTYLLGALARMPQAVSHAISRRLVSYQIKSRLEPLIEPALDGADVVVIGGVQLFGDANLNFPLKLAHLAAAAEARNLPIAIHSVGVSRNWAPSARALFAHVLTSPSLRFISVRDAASARNLRQHYELIGVKPPVAIHVTPDPGLIADEIETSAPAVPKGAKRVVGIGVVHPAALSTHATHSDQYRVTSSLAAYVSLVQRLVDVGCAVQVFTNGAGEDEEMLDRLWPRLREASGVTRVPRAETPVQLVNTLRSLDAIASHRLHACIGANALGLKAVGFKWDAKIDAYFGLTDQSENLFEDMSDARAVTAALMQPLSDQTCTKLANLKPRIDDGLQLLTAQFKGSGPEIPRAEGPNRPRGQFGPPARSAPGQAEKRSSSAHSETHASLT